MPMTYDHGFTSSEQFTGKRVEIPVHFDIWMRGARFGVVSSVGAGFIRVKMDNPRVRRRVRIEAKDFPFCRAEC